MSLIQAIKYAAHFERSAELQLATVIVECLPCSACLHSCSSLASDAMHRRVTLCCWPSGASKLTHAESPQSGAVGLVDSCLTVDRRTAFQHLSTLLRCQFVLLAFVTLQIVRF